jgi:hypothetical protein
MSTDGKKSDEDGNDLERTEEKSAAELDAIVKAAEGGEIEDEVTQTGDPDEIERAALASAHPGPDEDEPPPSSEAMPVSMREIEAEPASSRDFEPVSLHDVEVAMAPGKAPPKIPAAPPAPRVPAVPRAPAKAPTAASAPAKPGATKPALEDKPAGPVLAGAAATRPKIVPRAPLKARQASQPDPEEAGAVPAIRPRLSSVPPPLPKPGSDDEMLRLTGGLSGGLAAPLVPADLAPPQIADASSAPGETRDAPTEARARPAPPKKKRAPEAAADAPPSERAPASTSPKSKRSSKSPPKEDAAEADDAPKKSKRPPKSERPAAIAPPRPPADAQTDPPHEAPKSRTTTYVLIAAALAIGGYFAFGRSSEPPKPDVRTDVTSTPTGEPRAETVGTTPDAPTTPPPAETAAAPATSDGAPTPQASTGPTSQAARTPPTSNTTSTAPTAPPATAPTAATPPPTSKPAASSAPAVASGPFDRSAASAAMSSAVGATSGCKKEGDPSGVARVSVTFAPSGRVTQANIGGPPFAGTATGGCIAKAFKTAKVPPFEGDPVTVSKTVNIP